MAQRAIRGTRTRGFRPATDWAAVYAVGSLIADGVTGEDHDVFDLSLAATADLDNDPETVRRMRGRLEFAMTPAQFAIEGIVQLAMGIGVAPPQGIAGDAVPLPITDAHWDGWMWIWQVPVFTGDTPSLFNLVAPADGTIDSKAQRRLEDNSLFAALQIVTDAGEAQAVLYSFNLRWLLSESSRR